MKLFSGLRGFIARPTHDRRVALRQTCRFPLHGDKGEAGRPGPPLLFYFHHFTRRFYNYRVDCSAMVSVCADDSMQRRNRSIPKVAAVLFASHQFECETGCIHQLLKPASFVPIREHVKEQFPFQLFEKYFHEEGFIHGQPPTTRPSYERDAKNFHDSCQQKFRPFRPFSRRAFP